MAHPERFPDRPAFNEPPFNLGNFETIASRRVAHKRNGGHFSIGFSKATSRGELTSVASYVGRSGQVELASFRLRSPRGELALERQGEHLIGTARVPRKPLDGTFVELRLGGAMSRLEAERGLPPLIRLLALARVSEPGELASRDITPYFQDLYLLWGEGTTLVEGVVPLAPIRSKPRRTYEQLDTPFRPEGDHIPIRLAQILKGEASRAARSELSHALDQFGKDSGLYDHVEIKLLARTPSAAFEIVVTIGGQRINIADVGYGVSQVLPVVAEAVLAGQSTLLLQQPEVHLHPRAQAALGTFLTRLTQGRRIVVETHSDYLIDRVRQEVARGTIEPTSVLILYFERRGADTTVYPIHLDSMGNLIDAPDCYRSFFIQEEMRLLSRGI